MTTSTDIDRLTADYVDALNDPDASAADVDRAAFLAESAEMALTAPRFAWTVEGEPYAGELGQYAHDVEQAAYADLEVGPLFRLDAGRPVEVEVARSSYTAGDYLVVDLTVAVPGYRIAEARYRIDLRA